jgi:hypothetical protein
MNNQRVLNLERMDEQQAHRFFNELASNVGAQSESIRIRAAPRGLRHGDAPVWGAHPGSREDAGVPGGLPQPTRNAGGLSSRMVCGSRRASRTTAGGRSSTSWPSWSCTTARCDGTPATTRSRSRRPSGGRGGSSRWNRRSQARPNSIGYPLSGGCTEVRRSTPPNETTRCLKARRRRHLGIILLSVEDVGRAGPIPVYKKD